MKGRMTRSVKTITHPEYGDVEWIDTNQQRKRADHDIQKNNRLHGRINGQYYVLRWEQLRRSIRMEARSMDV